MDIPDIWTEPVRLALRAAFGVDAPDAIMRQSGGLSGTALRRIEVGGRPFLLRMDRPEEGLVDPRRWHRCMRIAADAGVAPQVLHADDNGVSIVAFVEQDGGRRYWARDRAAILGELGGMIRRLHATPPFPWFIDHLMALRGLGERVAATGILAAEEFAAIEARFATLAEAYGSLEPQLVSSHNDLHPANLVHDGQRLWLVDWQAAFLADRYADLAGIAGFLAREAAHAAVLLEAYFDAPATEAERARFYLARQLDHYRLGMAMLPTGAGQRPDQVRPLEVLHAALRAGEGVFNTPLGRAEYALARLDALVLGVEAPAFAAARRLAR